MADSPQVVIPLTKDTPKNEQVVGPVLNGGAINIRLTNPDLYWFTLMSIGLALTLGFNFALSAAEWGIPEPTFLIYDQSNYLWGGIFLAIGLSQFVFLHVFRNLRVIRATEAVSFICCLSIGYGTMQPFFDEKGSFQLPAFYVFWGLVQFRLLIMPFINPWTARRDNGEPRRPTFIVSDFIIPIGIVVIVTIVLLAGWSVRILLGMAK